PAIADPARYTVKLRQTVHQLVQDWDAVSPIITQFSLSAGTPCRAGSDTPITPPESPGAVSPPHFQVQPYGGHTPRPKPAVPAFEFPFSRWAIAASWPAHWRTSAQAARYSLRSFTM